MRQSVLALVLLLLLGPGLASPVRADDWVEGDGFRFRPPAGFLALPGSASTRKGFDLKTPFGGAEAAEAFLFIRQGEGQPPAFVMALSIRPDEAILDSLGGALDLDSLERVSGAKVPQMDGVVEYAAPQRTFIGGGQAALEFSVTYVSPVLGQRTMKCAVAVRDGRLITLYLDGDGSAADEQPAWQDFLGSFRIVKPGLIDLALSYGPYALGGLVLLLLVFLLRSRSKQRGTAWQLHATMAAPRPSGGALSRAADGLPLYDEAGAPPPPGGQHAAARPAPGGFALPSPATVPLRPQGVPLVGASRPTSQPADGTLGPASSVQAVGPTTAANPPGPSRSVQPAPRPSVLAPAPSGAPEGGGLLPTNVALRSAGAALPSTAPAAPRDVDGPPVAPDPGRQPEPLPASGPKLKIQRNSDFVR